MRVTRSLALMVSLVLSSTARAEGVPLTLSTSGYLLDASDHPLTQQGLSLRFSAWDDPASPLASSQVWPATGESECLVDVANGFYTAVLDGSLSSGCGAGLTSDHLQGGEGRYLQLSVGGTTLSPRLRVGSVPTAAFATQSADAQALTVALAASGTINTPGNPVDWSQLKTVPPGLADGTDNDTTYTAAGGLSLLGTELSIATGGVTNAMLQNAETTVNAGTGLTGGGAMALGGATTLGLANTFVVPDTYTYATLTVDPQGRITAASNGAAPTGTVTSVTAGSGLTGGTVSTSGTIALATDATSLAKVSGGAMTASGANIGIGTTSPGATLAVTGTLSHEHTFPNATSWSAARFRANVGDPATSFHNQNVALMSSNPLAEKQGGSLTLGGVRDAIGNEMYWSLIKGYKTNATPDDLKGELAISTNGGAGFVERLRVDSAGNVGIGSTTPGVKLDVAGDIRASGETWMNATTFRRMTSWMTCVARGVTLNKEVALITWPKDGACHTCADLCASAVGPNGTTGYTCMGGGYFGYSPTQNTASQGSIGERVKWSDCGGSFGPGCANGYGFNASMGAYQTGGSDGTGSGHVCCCGQ